MFIKEIFTVSIDGPNDMLGRTKTDYDFLTCICTDDMSEGSDNRLVFTKIKDKEQMRIVPDWQHKNDKWVIRLSWNNRGSWLISKVKDKVMVGLKRRAELSLASVGTIEK